MGSFSYSKYNSNKINFINDFHPSNNYIQNSISLYNSYEMNTISSFHLKNDYKTLKTFNNQSSSSIDCKKPIRNNRYNSLLGNINNI